jgi:hypothetical protein
VTTARAAATETPRAPARLDRRVLTANLIAGAMWLLLLAFASWPLALIGAAYVAAGSVFLAAVLARDTLTRRQEALAWAAPWLVAVALWTWLGAETDGGTSYGLQTLWFGLVIATGCYLAWQIVALAVRQLMAWRAGPASDLNPG